MDITELNAITGEVTERKYTAEEKAEYDAFVAKAKAELDAEIAANDARAADKAALLAKLGITADEAKLLFS
jgi:hypothetical protein